MGQAFGTLAAETGKRRVSVGRDCRLTSDRYAAAVTEGIRSTGLAVVDIGVVLARTGKTVEQLLADLPPSQTTPEIRIDCPDALKFAVAERVRDRFRAEGRDMIDVDGVRVRFPHGWGLLRASNTQPAVVMRFEAETAEQLATYQRAVEEAVAAVRAELGG